MSKIIIPQELKEAIEKYSVWVKSHCDDEQQRETITQPLYHYTNGNGLKGILENQKMWFTDFRHLNDPNELFYGMEICKKQILELAEQSDGRAGIFLKIIENMLSLENMKNFAFYFACFSRNSDELGQWRAYGDDGRGYSIGFAPKLFEAGQEISEQADENVIVTPVLYNSNNIVERNNEALKQAFLCFLEVANNYPELLRDRKIGIPFMEDFAKEVIGSPLILNFLTSKHNAYEQEAEVRMCMLGQPSDFFPHIKTRTRRSEIVPYVPHEMPLLQEGSITEIVLGSASNPNAEQGVKALLNSLRIEHDIPIRRSKIPYRAL